MGVGIVAAVSEVEINIIIIVFVLLATVHLGIVAAIAFVGLTIVIVVLLYGFSRLFLDGGRLFLDWVGGGRGCGCCRLGRCFIVVALRLSVLAVRVFGRHGLWKESIQVVEKIVLKILGLGHDGRLFVVCRGGRRTLPRRLD